MKTSFIEIVVERNKTAERTATRPVGAFSVFSKPVTEQKKSSSAYPMVPYNLNITFQTTDIKIKTDGQLIILFDQYMHEIQRGYTKGNAIAFHGEVEKSVAELNVCFYLTRDCKTIARDKFNSQFTMDIGLKIPF